MKQQQTTSTREQNGQTSCTGTARHHAQEQPDIMHRNSQMTCTGTARHNAQEQPDIMYSKKKLLSCWNMSIVEELVFCCFYCCFLYFVFSCFIIFSILLSLHHPPPSRTCHNHANTQPLKKVLWHTLPSNWMAWNFSLCAVACNELNWVLLNKRSWILIEWLF